MYPGAGKFCLCAALKKLLWKNDFLPAAGDDGGADCRAEHFASRTLQWVNELTEIFGLNLELQGYEKSRLM